MNTVGIVCEYNPLHLGHVRQMETIRRRLGSDTAIVCAMSGNYVQRGHPALLDKSIRAEAAVHCGADLVVELPVTVSLSSAEGFARQGVEILSALCDTLCFGAETPDPEILSQAAQAFLSPAFSQQLRSELDTGKSFPAARQRALEAMGLPALTGPNDLLAVEYCKAISSRNLSLKTLPILRQGDYHSQAPDSENPSATALRQLFCSRRDWRPYVPEEAASLFAQASLHTLEAGQRGILARLRSMTEDDFAQLPYGNEGLWRKLMRQCRQAGSLEELLTSVKSKRYTRSRLDRMVMCAYLGISQEMLEAPAPYARVLAFNDRGRAILKNGKARFLFLNAGEPSEHSYQALEYRAGDLYGLFQVEGLGPAGIEKRRRVCYVQA